MKALVARFLRDESASAELVSQAILVTGSALVVIPTVHDTAEKLIAVFTTLTKALR